MSLVSTYVLVGYEERQKEALWQKMNEVIQGIAYNEDIYCD